MNILKLLLSTSIRIMLGVTLGLLLVLPTLLYLLQDKLLFMPVSLSQQEYSFIRKAYPNSEVSLTTPDKVKLHGWFVNHTGLQKAPLLIYFGGNAEEVSWLLSDFDTQFKNMAFVLGRVDILTKPN